MVCGLRYFHEGKRQGLHAVSYAFKEMLHKFVALVTSKIQETVLLYCSFNPSLVPRPCGLGMRLPQSQIPCVYCIGTRLAVSVT